MVNMMDKKQQILQSRHNELLEELAAVYNQMGQTLSSVNKLKLKRQAEDIEKEIAEVEQKIQQGTTPVDNDSPVPTLTDVMRRLDEMEEVLSGKLNTLKRGQLLIYKRVKPHDQETIEAILTEVRQNRIEQGELQRILDAIRRTLKHIQVAGLPVDDKEIEDTLAEIYKEIVSGLGLQQQLELSLPVIPFLLEYKVALDAGVDLGAIWKELKERVGKKKSQS